MQTRACTSQLGSTLIEVLITVLIVSIGLLGMASLQLKSVSLNHSSYQRLQATNLAYDIADRIFVNGAQARGGNYTITLGAGAGSVAASDVTKADINDWLAIVDRLPGGEFSIGPPQTMLGDPNNIRNYQVTVCWQDLKNKVDAGREDDIKEACDDQTDRDFITFNASSKH